jgi:hypothetical protein
MRPEDDGPGFAVGTVRHELRPEHTVGHEGNVIQPEQVQLPLNVTRARSGAPSNSILPSVVFRLTFGDRPRNLPGDFRTT